MTMNENGCWWTLLIERGGGGQLGILEPLLYPTTSPPEPIADKSYGSVTVLQNHLGTLRGISASA